MMTGVHIRAVGKCGSQGLLITVLEVKMGERLRASRPDFVFVVCMCARYQAKPTKRHFEAIKRVFWYLKGTINMGLWYPKDNVMSLTAYADADHAGCQDSRRSTSGSAQFLGDRLVSCDNKRGNSALAVTMSRQLSIKAHRPYVTISYREEQVETESG
ncbi:hypothetical protein Tco_0545988 [Tanacetum coccineum]